MEDTCIEVMNQIRSLVKDHHKMDGVSDIDFEPTPVGIAIALLHITHNGNGTWEQYWTIHSEDELLAFRDRLLTV